MSYLKGKIPSSKTSDCRDCRLRGKDATRNGGGSGGWKPCSLPCSSKHSFWLRQPGIVNEEIDRQEPLPCSEQQQYGGRGRVTKIAETPTVVRLIVASTTQGEATPIARIGRDQLEHVFTKCEIVLLSFVLEKSSSIFVSQNNAPSPSPSRHEAFSSSLQDGTCCENMSLRATLFPLLAQSHPSCQFQFMLRYQGN